MDKAIKQWREKNKLANIPPLTEEQYTVLVQAMWDTLQESEYATFKDCMYFLEKRFPAGMQDCYTFRLYKITLEYTGILSLRSSFNKICGGI